MSMYFRTISVLFCFGVGFFSKWCFFACTTSSCRVSTTPTYFAALASSVVPPGLCSVGWYVAPMEEKTLPTVFAKHSPRRTRMPMPPLPTTP